MGIEIIPNETGRYVFRDIVAIKYCGIVPSGVEKRCNCGRVKTIITI